MTLAQPPIFDLQKDYAKFGLTLAEANRILDNRFENRQGSQAKYIVLHIQAGSTVGSLDWWANGPGVQASATVLAQKDGSLLRCIPEQHGPWTNGDVKQPLPEAADIIAEPGNPNLVSLTIEAEGWPFVAMPQIQKDAIAWQCMQWMTKYPEITIARIERHGAINSVDRPNCGLYRDEIIAIIEREMANQGTPYAVPLAIPDETYPLSAQVEALKDVVPRAWATSDAPRTGPNIAPRTRVQIKGEVKNHEGQQWFLLEDNSRVRASSFTPKITVSPR